MKTKAAWIAGLSVGIAGLGGGLGLAHRGASAGDGPPAQVIAKPAGQGVGERIRAVLDEHARSLQKQDVGDLFASLVTKQGRERSFAEIRDKTIETSRKLLDLIEQDPRDPESLRAMTWHVDQYWTSGAEGPLIDQLTRSVDVLLRHYADEPRIAFRVLVRPSTLPSRLDDRLTAPLAAAACRRETKGLALMALGEYLEDRARMALRIQATGGRYHFDLAPRQTTKNPLYDEAYEKVLRESDAVALFAEAEAVFARVAAEFADVMKPMRCPDDEEFMTWVPPGRLGDLAGGRLEVLRAVAIGHPAPDLTWTGADGRATRLSDLRGKVVLLSFRQVGEGPFEDEPAYVASHAARLKDRPFAVVAVDSPDAPIRSRLGVGRGYDLQLISWGNGSKVPTSGQNLAIAGTDNSGVLHIRTFAAAGARTDTYVAMEGGALHLVTADASGHVLSDTAESSLPAAQAQTIADLKQQIPGLLPPHVLSDAEREQVLSDAALITGQALGSPGAAILVDAAGRFRFQGRQSRRLDSYIDALVKEAEARK